LIPVPELDAAWRRRRRVANALLAGGVLVCAALVLWPAGFFPACPIHLWFGIECPGCGATRALEALLRGRWVEAVRLNALFVVLLPCGVGFAAESYRRAMRADEFRWPRSPMAAVWVTVGAGLVFTVLRNTY
jgi:uncharacterized protein DUF2752